MLKTVTSFLFVLDALCETKYWQPKSQANIPVVENVLNGAVFTYRMLNLMKTFDLPLRGGKQRYTMATCL